MRPRARLNKDTMMHLQNLPAGDQSKFDTIMNQLHDAPIERFMACGADVDECLDAHREIRDLLDEDNTPEKELRTIMLYGPDMAWHLMKLAALQAVAHDDEYGQYVDAFIDAKDKAKIEYWKNECATYLRDTPQGQMMYNKAFEEAWDNLIDLDKHLQPLDTLAQEAAKARSVKRSTELFANLIKPTSAINESPPFEHFQVLLEATRKELDDMVMSIDDMTKLTPDLPEDTKALWSTAKTLLMQSKGATAELEARAKEHYREAQYGTRQTP